MDNKTESARRISRKHAVIMIVILAVAAIGLLSGAAQAAMRSIQLNSPASFPVDI